MKKEVFKTQEITKKAKEYLGFSVQLKPVGSACNLRYKYCYAKPQRFISDEMMSEEVLECVVKKTLEASPWPTFSWHGGEPTLAGTNFFRLFVNLLEKYRLNDQKIRNLIQTNAATITPELAEIFQTHNFGVSVSLDGPAHVHGTGKMVSILISYEPFSCLKEKNRADSIFLHFLSKGVKSFSS